MFTKPFYFSVVGGSNLHEILQFKTALEAQRSASLSFMIKDPADWDSTLMFQSKQGDPCDLYRTTAYFKTIKKHDSADFVDDSFMISGVCINIPGGKDPALCLHPFVMLYIPEMHRGDLTVMAEWPDEIANHFDLREKLKATT